MRAGLGMHGDFELIVVNKVFIKNFHAASIKEEKICKAKKIGSRQIGKTSKRITAQGKPS